VSPLLVFADYQKLSSGLLGQISIQRLSKVHSTLEIQPIHSSRVDCFNARIPSVSKIIRIVAYMWGNVAMAVFDYSFRFGLSFRGTA